MKKRLFAAFLALVLALGMLPATALAADDDPAGTAPAPKDVVSTEDELQTALEAGVSAIRLNADITLTAPLTVDKSVTLDLAGKSIVSQTSGVAIGMSENVAADLRVIIRNGTIKTTVIIEAGTITFEDLTIAAPEICVFLLPNSTAAVSIVNCSIKSQDEKNFEAIFLGADNPNNPKVVFKTDSIIITGSTIKYLNEEAETYYISIPVAEGGEVIPNTRYAAAGERVTITAHPEDRYETDKITVTDMRGRAVTVRGMGKNQWSFVMPASKVDVTAVFAKIAGTEAPAQTNDIPGTSHTAASPDDEVFTGLGTPGVSGIVLNPAAMPFSDVRAGDWFYDSVEYVWKHYLMSGVSDTQFSPNATTTRGMIWTILARMNNVRTDINPGSTWYERGMLWCKEQGVTDGNDPAADITREQLATMLWRSAGSPGGNGDLSKFSDSAKVSGYAESAVRWAVGAGVLNGANGKLNPQGTATRAEVAAMVARYGDKVA